MDSGYSLSDIRAAVDGGDGMFGGNGLWFLALLFLFGNGGFGWGGQRGNVATTEDLASGFNFSSVGNRLNDIIAGQANINQNLSNAICQLGYQSLDQSKSLSQQLSDCLKKFNFAIKNFCTFKKYAVGSCVA